MKLRITCKEATYLIVKKEDGKLGLSKRMELFVHLLYCSFCKLFKKQNNILSKAVAGSKSDINLSQAEKTTLKELLKK